MGRHLHEHQNLNQAVLLDVSNTAKPDLPFEDLAISRAKALDIIDCDEDVNGEQIGLVQQETGPPAAPFSGVGADT
jgi:hypothetical protein